MPAQKSIKLNNTKALLPELRKARTPAEYDQSYLAVVAWSVDSTLSIDA